MGMGYYMDERSGTRFVCDAIPWAAKKFHVIPHALQFLDQERETARSSGKRTLIHAGRLYGPRRPELILGLLKEVSKVAPAMASQVEVQFLGRSDYPVMSSARELGVDSMVSVHDEVSFQEAKAMMQHADGIFVLDAFLNEPWNVFLPSKLMDGLALGKPILAITPENSPTYRVLKPLEHGLLTSKDPSANVLAFIDWWTRQEQRRWQLPLDWKESIRAYEISKLGLQLENLFVGKNE
jgi:hypothetical protein